ncbi:MAG: IPTL-CTERM sorting domain-containing protein [Cocleimonas sp.]
MKSNPFSANSSVLVFNKREQVKLKSYIFGFFLSVIASPVSADITGTIYRDYNLNGTQEPLEPGVEGLTVTAYDDTGPVLPVAITDASGNYVLITPSGKYRVEVSGTPSYLNPGTAINGSTQPLVSFANDATSHHIGMSNASEYCQANPDIIVSRFVKGSHTSVATNTRDAILQYNYEDNGTTAATDISPPSLVGSVYGVAHFRKSNVTYVSSYFKRHADLGPDGIGAIYKVDRDAANAVSTFVDLGGIDPRGVLTGYDWNHDTNGYVDVAKIGIGDIELSDDETKLFAVNMEDRKLYVFDLDANGDRTATASFNIPKPCVAQTVADDSRPMGLGFNDGTLYVGVTCTAESTVTLNHPDDSYLGPRKGDSSKLSAHVYSFNPSTDLFSAAPLVDIPLDYGRGCIYNGDISNAIPPAGCAQLNDMDGVPRPFIANWLPWQMDYDIVANDKKPGNVGNQFGWNEYPQPLLSDIEFDNDGSMIIQIKDVNGDRTGYQNHSPNPVDNTLQNGNAMGDIIRACGNHQTGWILESNGSCGGVTTGGANNQEGLGGGEYYWYDNGPGGNGSINPLQKNGHADTVMGGMLHIAGYPDIVTTAMDVHNFADNGLLWLRNDTGQISTDGTGDPKRLLVSEVDANLFFGKASGLGDIEALCDPAPIEIGNYVWADTNENGVQDPSEFALNNVTVSLYEDTTLVGTAVTDTNGEYYFGGVTNMHMAGNLPLKPLTTYQIRIDLNQPNLGGRVPTLKDANTNNDDQFDSDGDNSALNVNTTTIEYTTGNVGASNHTLDFGFINPVPSIDIEKATNTVDADIPAAAVVLNAGDTVTWSFVVTNSGNDVLNNISANDNKEGAISCPKIVLISGESMSCTALTGTAVSGDYTNIASVTGTGSVSGIEVNDSDPSHYTVTPKVSVGNIVWNDNGVGGGTANDGIINGAEVGIANVLIELYKAGEDPASTAATASTTTEVDGSYVFDSLEEGTYFVHIPVSEFGTGKPLNKMYSSHGQGATNNNNDDGVDENGDDDESDGVSSQDILLQANSEPLGEAGFSGVAQSTQDDDNTNMTIDFGFIPTVQIGSLVWFEDDNDGDATTGVITYPPAGTMITATAPDGTIYTDTTDEFGNYGIEVPINQTYRVKITPPVGYDPTNGSGDNTADDGDNLSHDGEGTDVIVVIADNLTVDFGFIPAAAPPPIPSNEPIPTLSEWALLMLMMMLGFVGYRQGMIRKN